MTRRLRVLALAVCIALVGAACTSPSSSPPDGDGGSSTSAPSADTADGGSATQERVTLRLGAISQGGGYPTPYAAIRGPGRLKTTMIFDTLTFPDVTGQPKPWLATSWDTSDDGLTWTFHLRDDVVFHDGEPLTADDVVFSFEYNMTGPGADTSAALSGIASVSAPDDTTVVITTEEVQPSFLDDISGPFGVAILPQHIWADVTDPAKFQGEDALVGSGPYKVADLDVATGTFDFVAFDDFFAGAPVVKRLQIIQVNDELLALQRGEIDAASALQAAVPEAQMNALSQQFKLLTAPGEYNVALFFNQDAGFPYNEKAFRQGVLYALDRNDMIDRLVGGAGVPGSAGNLGPANAFLNEDLPQYAFDLGKANQLFDEVGLVDADGDGVRDLPDGSSFSIPLVTSERDIQEAQLITEYLRAAGITVAVESVDQPTMDERAGSNKYSMAVVHFGGLSADPGVLAERFSSDSQSGSFTRVPSFSNAEFDRLAAQQATILDRQKRADPVDMMQAILAEQVPAIGLYVPEQRTFVNEKKWDAWAYTPGCPPCGASMNKRMLVTGSTEPVPVG